MHLDGIESSEKKYFLHGHDTQIDKRASFRTNGQTSKFLDFLIFLIILTLITCLFGFLATRVYVALKRYFVLYIYIYILIFYSHLIVQRNN